MNELKTRRAQLQSTIRNLSEELEEVEDELSVYEADESIAFMLGEELEPALRLVRDEQD